MARIGIDFGTSYTTMSYVDNGGRAVPIKVHGKEKIPTMLYFPKEGDILFGEAAYNKYQDCKGADTPEQEDDILGGIIAGLKRDMSRSGIVHTPQGNKSYPAVISLFFKYLKEYAEKYVFEGEPVTDVCLTYPVSFDNQPEKKEILRESAVLAGFDAYHIKLLKEPVAALMGYENTHDIKDKGVLIYDFGGGTFDAYYVMFDYNGVEHSLSPVGDGECGGENIDRALYEYWDKRILSLKQRHISLYDDEVYLPILKKDCVEQKEQYSKGQFSSAFLILPPSSSVLVKLPALSSQEWNDIVEPWVDKTVLKVRQLLKDIEEHNSEDGAMHFSIDKILLIGGSSRLPMVYEKLKDVCPVEPTPVHEFDVEVANGAAIYVNKDFVKPERCYCMYCGDGNCGTPLMTNIRFCPKCGRENERYDRCFDDL